MKTERNNNLESGKKERRKKQKRDYATRKRQEDRRIFEDLQSTNKHLHRRNRRKKQQIEKLKSWAMYARSYLSLCTQLVVSRPAPLDGGITSESGVTSESEVTSEVAVSLEVGMASDDGVTSEIGMSSDERSTSESGVTSDAGVTSEAGVSSEVGVRPKMTAMSEADVTSSSPLWPSADSTVIDLGNMLASGVKEDWLTFNTGKHLQETMSLDPWGRQQQTSSTDDDETFAVPDSTVVDSGEEDLNSVEVHVLKSLVFDALLDVKISPDGGRFDGKTLIEGPCVQFHGEDFFLESFERGGLAYTSPTERVST